MAAVRIRYVPPPAQGTVADEILAIHASGFRSRLAQAQAAADESYARDQAGYAARVAMAQKRLEAAQKDAAEARKVLAGLDVKDAEGRVSALKTITQLQMSAAHLASYGGPPPVADHIRQDPFQDQLQKDLAAYPGWDKVYPSKGTLTKDEKADRRLLDQALEAVSGSGDPGLDKVLAVAYLDGQGLALASRSMVDLRQAALKEALSGSENTNGLHELILQAEPALRERGVQLSFARVDPYIQSLQDVASKGGNNPAEAAANAARPKGGGGAPKAAATGIAAEAAAHPEQFTPDYSAARHAAEAQLASANAAAAGVDFPEAPLFLDRIARTRNAYDAAYGGARTSTHPADAWLDELERTGRAPTTTGQGPYPVRPATYEMSAKEQTDARMEDAADAAAKMSEAMDVIAAPVPTARPHPAAQLLEGLGFHADDPAPVIELPEMTITAKYKPLLEQHGLLGRGGRVRKLRAERLATTTPEGQAARRALTANGGDLSKAHAALKDPRAQAIAAALVA